MLPSHKLQPLDVGCFSFLERAYGRHVENGMWFGINHINKIDFLSLLPTVRSHALKSDIFTIDSALEVWSCTNVIGYCLSFMFCSKHQYHLVQAMAIHKQIGWQKPRITLFNCNDSQR
jgi:hypothetical protein